MGGLACAYRLQQAGHAVTVFDARAPGVGGPHDDPVRPAGPMHWGFARVGALMDAVGAADGAAAPPLAARPVGVRAPGLGLGGNLRRLAFLQHAIRAADDTDLFDLCAGADDLDGVDAWTATAARFGEDIAERVLDPMVRSVHPLSSRRVSMKYAVALVRTVLGGARGARVARRLPGALARVLPVRAPLAVAHVVPGADGVTLRFRDREADFQAAVLATPAPVVRTLLTELTPEQRAFLDGVRYATDVRCVFRAPAGGLAPYRGRTVAFHESTLVATVSAVTVGDHGEDGRVCVCLHDEAAAALLPLDDDTVLSVVGRELARITDGRAPRLLGLAVRRQAAALPVHAVGDSARARAFWARGQGTGRVWLCGGYLGHPWLEGAVRCAERVADGITEGT